MLLDPHDLRDAVPLWSELAGATCRLINHSENHTFLFDGPRGRYTLRVHRPDYQSLDTIESELAWLEALRRDTSVPVPRPVAGVDGRLLQQFVTASGQVRQAVLFCFLSGSEPNIGQDLTGLFSVLGRYAAQLHTQVTTWERPSNFARQAWNSATILDVDGLWGDWRVAPGVDPQVRSLLDRAAECLKQDLADYGVGPDRYGLIHADMRLGNILVDGRTVNLIDFDDSGFCWFTYDLAASLSFYETHQAVPQLMRAWIDGYKTLRPLSEADIASIEPMILLRRFALLAWIGTHSETLLAQAHMPGFAAGAAELAQAYLASRRS
jgi:Ser/Thr protein kinase RdoA (MazF antagonist)